MIQKMHRICFFRIFQTKISDRWGVMILREAGSNYRWEQVFDHFFATLKHFEIRIHCILKRLKITVIVSFVRRWSLTL